MNNVLYHLCRHNVSIMGGWYPFPSTCLSELCGLSLYQTRKVLKSLKEQGLVVSDRYCDVGEDGNIIVNGYKITEKAKSTEEYRVAWDKERELCKESLQIDIGEME